MYKKHILSRLLLFIFLLPFTELRADEGMWLLALLKKQNADALKSMGLKTPIDQLSGATDGALSESVIAFGSGCTASIISNKGLVLTNYHCSYDAIQQYITPTTDIYKNGYWANNQAQELNVKGLSVTINKKIVDITDEVKLFQNTQTSRPSSSEAQAAIAKKYQLKYPNFKTLIKTYKNNSISVLFLQLRYDDVRLVGVPPKNVAKFGGETDNWMWPRQSADFAYFRIYGNKAGMPAPYSSNNIPLEVKNWLHISIDGYRLGDLAMSLGYPGLSDRKALSFKIKEKTEVLNPPMIATRKVVQAIWEDEMNKNPLIKQMYAEKFASSANYYKNAIGMNVWVNKLNIITRKAKYEKEWMNWAIKDTTKKNLYVNALQEMQIETESKAKVKRAQAYFSECFEACEVIKFSRGFGAAFKTYPIEIKKNPSLQRDLLNTTLYHFKRFNAIVDKRITKAMLKLLKDSVPFELLPDVFAFKGLHQDIQIDRYVEEIFQNSAFSDSTKLKNWLKNPSTSLVNDPIMELGMSIEKKQRELFKVLGSSREFYRNAATYENSVDEFRANEYYPEADKTIRLSYGTVSNLVLDGKIIPYQTSLSSLIAKADTVNKDYQLNKKLLEIWQRKDFGKYAINNDIPVDFITNGDVTGGNSGSPMINAEGKIIGLVFDCNWESMTREFNYEKDLHKVICADIRYVLLITEKFSGSRRIVGEIEAANQ